MKISEVSKITELTKRAIRYYENEGLINPNINEENNYREYDEEDVNKLIKISLLRQLDLSIDNIKDIINKSINIRNLLKNHVNKLEEDISQMEKSKTLIESIINDTSNIDSEKIIEKMKLLRNYIDSNDKQKQGYIKRQLQRIFPDKFGIILTLRFVPFLNEPIDSPEKEKAWIEIVKFLDEAEEISYPEEIEKSFENISYDDLETIMEGTYKELNVLINPTKEELEEYKKKLIEFMETSSKDKEFRKAYSELAKPRNKMRKQLSDIGYYDKFTENMKILSKDYKKYHENLIKLDDELGLEYDEEGFVILKEDL
ncbi:putative transcriptional regulator [Gottschalkia purinilytica]|uniref:Putative transcriptional regulator n=1 Tax=Gottschalkia purinilytica TaxID=1503 RepID=A0A0L0WA03_GOTPU|nr:MerR family transcriptional regulator [Gottschalkia purinilytica]KNF08296.1 putative transcriptional regulator [Gottschalkia purinilytica]